MTYLERLTATGMNPECAMDAVAWYTFQGDDEGLEKYVCLLYTSPSPRDA